MGGGKDKNDDDNKEYDSGYHQGRNNDFMGDALHTFSDTGSIWDKGYQQGSRDRAEHGSMDDKDSGSSGSSSSDSGSSGGCFITTACVKSLGLPDNCLELKVLRKFRDRVLLQNPGGRREVREYYKVSPEIVSVVNNLPTEESSRIWRRVHSTISYVISSIMEGDYGEAFDRYKNMTLELKKAHL